MEKHTTDTPCDRWFVAEHADLWASIDYVRACKSRTMDGMEDDELLDSLGYEDRKIEKMASVIRERR